MYENILSPLVHNDTTKKKKKKPEKIREGCWEDRGKKTQQNINGYEGWNMGFLCFVFCIWLKKVLQ